MACIWSCSFMIRSICLTLIAVLLSAKVQGLTNTCSSNQNTTLTVSDVFSSTNTTISPYYSANTTCVWNITAPASKVVQLTVSVGTFDHGGDTITIYDGPSTSSPIIISTSYNYFTFKVTGKGRSMYVVFKSDGSTTVGTGFTANFTTITNPTGLLSGYIQSKYYGYGDYPNNMNEGWLLKTAANKTFRMLLDTVDMNSNDYVRLYDGKNASSTLIKSVTGGSEGWGYHQAFTTTGSLLYVNFTSDASGGGWGFRLNFWEQGATVKQCNASAVSLDASASGIIKTPNYGTGYYFPGENCYWYIYSASGTVIELNITVGMMGRGGDIFYIFDGSGYGMGSLVMFQSYANYYSAKLVSRSNQAFIMFTSNSDLIVGDGFQISYSQVTSSSPTLSGYIETLNYPNGNYMDNQIDGFLINVLPNSNFSMVLSTGRLEAGSDILSFYDGTTDAFPQLLQTSSSNYTATIVPTGKSVFVKFTSDYAVNYNGFHFSFTETSNSNCTANCSANARCSGDTCVCMYGYTGAACTEPLCACQNNGTCIAPFLCNCTVPGWTGFDCGTAICTAPCVNGNCSQPNVCTCETGWTDSSCTTPICNTSCSNGGNCTLPDICSCPYGWTDPTCTTPTCSMNGCINGNCTATDVCTCSAGWVGVSCSNATCTNACLNGGSCTAPEVCTCAAGWSGATCATPTCTVACQQGNCTAPDTCTCLTGWSDTACSTPICSPPCLNANSVCSAPNTCTCISGWTGVNCSSAVCSTACANGGSCTAPNICSCSSGWTGATCLTANCSIPCQNGGSCAAPNTCSCTAGWSGPQCSIAAAPTCSPACANGGSCVALNTCSCGAGWTGALCGQSTAPTCSPACGSGGSCVTLNTCSCGTGWTGSLCDQAICSSACLNNGSCSTPDVCSCLVGYSGTHCENSTIPATSDLLKMTTTVLANNVPTVTTAVTNFAKDASDSGNITNVANLLSTIGTLMSSYGNAASGGSVLITADTLVAVSQAFSSAADGMLFSVTNNSDFQSVPLIVDAPVDKRCSGSTTSSISSTTASTTTTSSINLATTKAERQQVFDAFIALVQNMFTSLKKSLPPGQAMTFSGGKFFSATVKNVLFSQLPGLKLETTFASIEMATTSTPSDLISAVSSGCSALTPNSVISITLAAYTVNIKDIDQSFTSPTVSVHVFCPEQLELTLNPSNPMRVVITPSGNKVEGLAYETASAQCLASQGACDEDNVDTMGTMVKFPISLGDGDFLLNFPAVDLNYTAYVAVNMVPSVNSYHIRAITKKTVEITKNGTFSSPRTFYAQGDDLRIIIQGEALTQLVGSNTSATQWLYVYMKKDLSGFPDLTGLPASACKVQECIGYYLDVGFATSNVIARRRRRSISAANNTDGFEVDPESSQKSIVFKSSYFGDYGADLVITPNTIEFGDIFANFATLVAQNAAVLAFQVAIVCMALAAIVLASKLDRDDLKEWAFMTLTSNKSHQRVKYLISTHYMKVKNFKLVPKISLRLIGSVQSSPWRLLDDGVRKNFDGKHPANFTLTTDMPLGKIDAVEFKVQSELTSPSSRFCLHVDRIIVVDVDGGQKSIYLAKANLEAGEAIRVEMATEHELKGYSYLVSGQTRTSFTDIHPWVSVAKRPLPSNWTRCERLACVASALFMAMMVNAMFYGKETTAPKVGVKVGGWFTLSWFTIWTSFIGCLIVIPPTAIIAFIFKKVQRKSAEKSHWTTVFNVKVAEENKSATGKQAGRGEQEEKSKKPFRLPFYCVIISWLLVAACIGTSSFIVVMYSLAWGQSKSLQWLAGMVITIFQDIILIQPVKVVLSAIFSATLHNLPDDGVSVGNLAYNKNSDKKKIELFFRLRNLIAGIFHHIIYVVIFAIVIATMANSYAYTQISTLRPLTAVRGVNQFTDSITDYSKIYEWLNKTLITNFLTGNQLEQGGIYPTANILYKILNPNIVILGPIRLRQQRVSGAVCPITFPLAKFINRKMQPEALLNNNTRCQNVFANSLGIGDSTERRSFNGSWFILHQSEIPNSNVKFDRNNVSVDDAPWVYRDTDGAPYAGWEATYKSGGYFIDLPRKKWDALSVVATLRKNRWLDNSTTVFIVDFNLFNAQVNLFVPVRIVFEALGAGGMSYHVRMFPLQLYQYSGASSMLVFVVQGLWVFILISHLVRLIRTMRKQGFKTFRRDGWNMLDLAQILLGLAIVAVFAARIYFVINTVTSIQTMRKSYINMDVLVSWEDVMFCMLGIEFFLTMMLFFRHLSVNQHWAVLIATLSKGKLDLIAYGFMFCLATVFFAGIGYLIMGHTYWDFCSYTRSIMTLVQAVIGTANFSSINTRFALFLTMLYNAVVVFLGGNIFVTLILSAHSRVTTNIHRETKWDSDLSSYMKSGIIHLFSKKDSKMGGASVKLIRPGDDNGIETSSFKNGQSKERNLSELEKMARRMENLVNNMPASDMQDFVWRMHLVGENLPSINRFKNFKQGGQQWWLKNRQQATNISPKTFTMPGNFPGQLFERETAADPSFKRINHGEYLDLQGSGKRFRSWDVEPQVVSVREQYSSSRRASIANAVNQNNVSNGFQHPFGVNQTRQFQQRPIEPVVQLAPASVADQINFKGKNQANEKVPTESKKMNQNKQQKPSEWLTDMDLSDGEQ